MTQRSLTQNAALHKYFELMADELNNTPHASVQEVVTLPISWTKNNFKEIIWHKVQLSMFPDAVNEDGEPSTAKLTTKEVGEVYEEVNRLISKVAGVGMEFPSYEEQRIESLTKEGEK